MTPPLTDAPTPGPATRRPGWLVPLLLAAAALVVVASVGVTAWALGRTSAQAPIAAVVTTQAPASIAPIEPPPLLTEEQTCQLAVPILLDLNDEVRKHVDGKPMNRGGLKDALDRLYDLIEHGPARTLAGDLNGEVAIGEAALAGAEVDASTASGVLAHLGRVCEPYATH